MAISNPRFRTLGRSFHDNLIIGRYQRDFKVPERRIDGGQTNGPTFVTIVPTLVPIAVPKKTPGALSVDHERELFSGEWPCLP
jgi:hypothetical protein